MRHFILTAAMLATFVIGAPARAAELVYTATLSGHQEPTNTSSPATGTATIRVNTETHAIDAQITISGLPMDKLSMHLAHSAMGPMHLHRYAANGDVTLILPFPMGETYAATATGFTVTEHGYAYADGAAIVNSGLSFDQFIAAMASDPIFLNVHTDAFPEGEISGRVTRVS